ncbi:MAG: TetR family transcriptional regulator, partial [Sphingomonas sp.]
MAHGEGSRAGAGRRYGGIPAAERRAGRRERLIRAAIALYGAQGYR